MNEQDLEQSFARVADWFFRRWTLVLVLSWLAYSAVAIAGKWQLIQAFALPDTDDNLRMAQVLVEQISTGRGLSTCPSPGSSC